MIRTLHGTAITSFIAICAVAYVVTHPGIWPFAALLGLALGTIALVASNKKTESGINTTQHWQMTLGGFGFSVLAYVCTAALYALQGMPGATLPGLFFMFFFMTPLFFSISYLVAAMLLVASQK